MNVYMCTEKSSNIEANAGYIYRCIYAISNKLLDT